MTQLILATRCEAAPGESESGDWVGHLALPEPAATWLMVVDGLGHGPEAAHAARAARDHLASVLTDPALIGQPASVLGSLNPVLRDTRGAAVGLASVHRGQLQHAGMGNTRCCVWRDGRLKGLPSAHGIVGAPTVRSRFGSDSVVENTWTLMDGDWILMFSDGLAENIHVDVVPGDWAADPRRLCDHLLQRWRVPRDDAAVLAACVLQA
jgi:Stage II sporulation protein E (SpoIIE)